VSDGIAEATVVAIKSDSDIVAARQAGRVMARRIGFAGSELTFIAAAISEVARNIVEYAKQGEIEISMVQRGSVTGIVVVARDQGPGIADLQKALQDGFSTAASLGMGLPGARRLMDEFEIASAVGRGTVVTMRKWRP
jgi:serine/threonine-protein kinase RsbT